MDNIQAHPLIFWLSQEKYTHIYIQTQFGILGVCIVLGSEHSALYMLVNIPSLLY